MTDGTVLAYCACGGSIDADDTEVSHFNPHTEEWWHGECWDMYKRGKNQGKKEAYKKGFQEGFSRGFKKGRQS